MKLKKSSKVTIIIGIIVLGINALLLGLGILYLLGAYIVSIGIGMEVSSRSNIYFVALVITVFFMIIFVCWASYGANFLLSYAIAFALSILVYFYKGANVVRRKIGFVSLMLVLLSCCYFISSYLVYLSDMSIAISAVFLLYSLLTRVSARKNN